jgi:drug/metabolite transporter (DMT)-like permease
MNWAPWVFVLLWSTGFVGAKFGMPHAEPFTFLAVRFLITLVPLIVVMTLSRTPWPSLAQAWPSGVSGILFHAVYLGGVFSAVKLGLPAGLAALIVSLQPVLTTLVAGRLLGERTGPLGWLGLGLGLLGVVLVVQEKLLGAQAHFGPTALAWALVGLFGTTAGTLFQKRYNRQMNLLSGTTVQYAGALAVLALASLTETRQIEWVLELVLTMAWLILAISLGAVFLLMHLIRHNSAGKVSSLYYLVPPLSALQGYIFFGETLGAVALLGFALTVLGVYLVMSEARLSEAETLNRQAAQKS